MTDPIEEENEANGENKSVEIPGYANFSNYVAEGYKVIMQGVKASGSLPAGRNYQFYQTYTNFRDKMREKYSEVQDIMEDILRSQGVKSGVRDVMMEDAVDTMITLNDKLLDRATRYMDLMEGIKTGLGELVQEVSGSWNRNKQTDKTKGFSLSIKKNIPRPQFVFKDKVDNGNTIWEPKIKDKPHALKPLAILVERNEDGDECFSHPYEYELEMFSVPEGQLKRIKNVKKPLPLEETPLQLVDTEEQLKDLVSYLETQPALAVDLEHHSYRSFLGFTCLIQISTREKDFIVDSLALRHALHCLNQVFTNPKILKVFHGADQDVVWLQRDFSVYLVNMFDTHQAAKLLNYPKLSLAYLLNAYCKVDANKHFQLFDWRTRPLPDEAVKYAREDTHYLLYIADMMSNQLIDKANGNTNILKAAYEQSKQVCMKRFEKLVIDEDSYMSVYRKGKRFFDNRQLFALKALYLWRDKTARELDESLAYVFPDSMMLNVAENLPREVQGILACCNPVPPLVKVNLFEIHYLIVRAKEQPLIKVIQETTQAQVQTQKAGGVSEEQLLLEQWYHPPGEVRDDLPTLLGDNSDNTSSQDNPSEGDLDISYQPSITLFNKEEKWFSTSDDSHVELDSEILDKLNGLNFVSPYQRYVRVLPYAAQIEKERKEQEAKQAEEHRQKSREQQALAMEIKSLQESGLIKLKRDDEEAEQARSLKVQLMAERKRKGGESQNDIPSKQGRKSRRDRRNQNNGTTAGETSPYTEDNVASTSSNDHFEEVQPELRGTKPEDIPCSNSNSPATNINRQPATIKKQLKREDSELPAVVPVPEFPAGLAHQKPHHGDKRASSWKELRQQKQKGFKPFNYSQVDYNQKFGAGVKNQQQNRAQTSSVLDKKRKWKNNPGAQKFAKKKRKRNPVV